MCSETGQRDDAAAGASDGERIGQTARVVYKLRRRRLRHTGDERADARECKFGA